MATYYIFRHGETFATKQNTGYGYRIFSADILEEGKPTIKKLAEYLKTQAIDHGFTSPVKRCLQTTNLVSEITGKYYLKDKRLGEFFWEPFGHFRRRVASFVREVEAKGYQNVAVCTHQAVIVMLLKILRKEQYQNSGIYNYPFPGILTIVDEKQMREINFREDAKKDI